jgi:hypothetical protein
VSGPFETERQAAEAARGRTLGAIPDTAAQLAMLEGACATAGVDLGAYDLRILAWLAGWEPQMCAVVAGLITRANAAGRDGAR